MKLLVTGGTGLVGSVISADIKISSKDVDLKDSHEANAAFKVFTKGMEEETQKLKEILKKEDILTEQERNNV